MYAHFFYISKYYYEKVIVSHNLIDLISQTGNINIIDVSANGIATSVYLV